MKNTAPLSQSQYGIYVDSVSHENEAYYNLPYLYVLDGSLDADRLCRAIETAVKAHPTLFTRIEVGDDGEPRQTIDMENESFSLSVEQITDIETEKQKLIVPFKIYGDRLFHIRLLRDTEHFYWLLDIHHIIGDGTSLKVMLHDVEKAYNGDSIAPEQLTMAEVATAESELRKSAAFEEGKRWYAQNFDCSDTFTPLLPDLEIQEHSENSMVRVLNVDMARVDDFCKTNDIFKSNLFTTVYSFLLAKYNNEQESLFTTVYNGRTDKRFLNSVGMTVKTLPVYAKFADETTVLDFLKAGQDQMSGCREHDVYAFSDVMTDLNLQSNSMFVWHGLLFADEQLMGKPMQTIRLCNSTLEASLYLKAFILNNQYHIKAEYNSNEYSEKLIATFLESYETALEGFLTQTFLRDIDICTENQCAVLEGFNQTEVEYDHSETIVSLFRKQAAATPDNIALVYKDKHYTYREVDEISDRIAAYIHKQGLQHEDVVSVLIPRSEWMAIASLGVVKAGCAYQPLDPSYPSERLNFMMKDADAKLLIADEELRPIVNEYQGDVLLTKDITTLPNVDVNSQLSTLNSKLITPSSLFIMLYTSGTTGTPKGCQLEHRNIVAFCEWYQRKFHLTYDCRVSAYASYGFDACMMDLYPALTCGATVHIIPEELRLDLVALNEYFENQYITHAFMTTQVAYQFATSIENHGLRYLLTGGEKLAGLIPPTNYTLVNIYGPTESTVCVTNFDVTEPMNNIPIGAALDNIKLYVVDKAGRRQPVGAAGELWVAGQQVSRGYLNRPEKTAEVYIDNPFTTNEQYAHIYRTGDIVRYLPDGNIQFVGRKDGQVKIRGFRIELKEVETVIRQFPGIKDATVQAFDEEGGGKFIAAYIVADEQIDIEAMNDFIMDQKPPYMVPAVTMQIDRIPLNQNQKVNKKALPKPVKELKVESLELKDVPMNMLEEKLHRIIADVVKTEDFGVTTVLGYVGLTSISAIRLATLIYKQFGVSLDAKSLVKTGTVQSIENEILDRLLNASSQVQSASESNNSEFIIQYSELKSVPLSYAQTGVYFECMKNPASTIYNIPYLLTYPDGIDANKLADSVKTVAETHPELFVRFDTEGDAIVQTTKDREPLEVALKEMTDEQLTTYKRDFVRPFNLKKSPLCRFEVVKTESGVHLLMDTHHLVFDGGSADLLIRQINEYIDKQTVTKETYTYFDFVNDQQIAEDSDTFKASQKFFAEMLQTCEGASEIPADLPKNDRQGWIGEAVCPVNHEPVTAFCRKMEITPAHLFLAATSYVVSRYTNNRDVYLCTVSSGRSNLKISETVGMFVNTLALGMSIDDVTTAEFLRAVSETFDQALRHEDYPFARIASDYGFRPAIAYAYQVGVLSQYAVNGKLIQQELLELNVPKFKINIKIEDRGVVVQYDDSLYSAELGQSLAESIVTVATNMMAQSEGKVRKLSIVSERQAAALATLRQTATADAPFRFFHECIHYYAEQQPDHQALVAVDSSYTYREMDEMTNRIANALRERGVRERDRVALLLPRTSRLILSLFGVLKSGAAYIPCDPDYPVDRIKLILEDSEARYIITTADRMETVPEGKAINVEDLLVETGHAPSLQFPTFNL